MRFLHALPLWISIAAAADAKPFCGWSAPSFWKEAWVRDIRRCLGDGIDVDGRGLFGRTPLHYASSLSNVRVVRLLIDAGAEIDALDLDGMTPLHRAALFGNAGPLRALIDAGADIDARADIVLELEGESGLRDWTSLHFAAGSDSARNVQILVEAGVAVDARKEGGDTPLHVAARNHRDGAARALIDAGAEMGARDEEGRTALHIAAEWGATKIVRDLTEAGAEVDAKDHRGDTPLLAATRSEYFGGGPDTIRGLIELDENSKLHPFVIQAGMLLAAQRRHDAPGTVRVLLDAGADPTQRASDGSLAADLAERNQELRDDPVFRELDEARSRR